MYLLLVFCEGGLVHEGLVAVGAGEQVVLGVAAQGLQVQEGLRTEFAGKQVPRRRGASWESVFCINFKCFPLETPEKLHQHQFTSAPLTAVSAVVYVLLNRFKSRTRHQENGPKYTNLTAVFGVL